MRNPGPAGTGIPNGEPGGQLDLTKPILADVIYCARCMGDHTMEFKPFKGHPIDDNWNWWGICPTTGDPVLLRLMDDDEELQ